MLKKYKVHFWKSGRKCVVEIEATSKYNAKARFYLHHSCDDIIRIEEVVE